MRLDRLRPVKQSERGASAVEFAIVLSVLMLFVFGTIQFGIAYNRDQGLKAAAREGARIASVGGTEDRIRARVEQAQSLFQPADIKLKIDYSRNNGVSWTAPNGGMVCDDTTNTPHPCTQTLAPTPCGEAGVSHLVRVTAIVPGSTGKYAIVIPLWGNANITFSASGVFRCEKNS
jgi:Flp pilus assembly protein TadG